MSDRLRTMLRELADDAPLEPRPVAQIKERARGRRLRNGAAALTASAVAVAGAFAVAEVRRPSSNRFAAAPADCGGAWHETPVNIAGAYGGRVTFSDAVVVAADDMWLAGSERVPGAKDATVTAHWNGQEWTRVDVPRARVKLAAFGALAADRTGAWLAETVFTGEVTGPVERTLSLYRYEEGRWAAVEVPAEWRRREVGSIASQGGSVILGLPRLDGTPTLGTVSSTLIAYDGSAWRELPALPSVTSYVDTVAYDENGTLYVQAWDEKATTTLWSLRGSTWTAMRQTPEGTGRLPLDVASSTDIWHGNAHFDGSVWRDHAVPGPDGSVLTAVGSRSSRDAFAAAAVRPHPRRKPGERIDDVHATSIVRWNGSRWVATGAKTAPGGEIFGMDVAPSGAGLAAGAKPTATEHVSIVMRRC